MSDESEIGREPLPEEEYADMVDLQVTEHAAIRVESELLYADFDTYDNDGLECGVSVTKDGGRISLSAGTVDDSETPHMYAWCGLDPDQAREIAAALTEAADGAERAREESGHSEEETKSFLKRLVQ